MYIHLIHKRWSSELLHCALLHTQTAMHHGCNEFVHCCIPRLQSIVVHIASMANTRMSLSHSRHLQVYLKICYIHGVLWSGYATMHNATIQKTTFFELDVYLGTYLTLTLKLAGEFNDPLGFFGLKFLPLEQLPNAFAQLFLDNEDILH